MLINKFIYCLRAALHNMRRSFMLNTLAVSTIAVTFVVFITFLIMLFNLSVLKKHWLERGQIVVYFTEGAPAESVEAGRAAIAAMQDVESAVYVSSSEALAILESALAGQDGILEGLPTNPLPDSVEINLKNPGIGDAELLSLIEKLRRLHAVDDVEYGQKWYDRFKVFFKVIRAAGICIGGLLFLFTLVIISNTIRIMLFIRRDEIEIMRLVGATSLFIKLPFCIEGVLQGIVGSAAALMVFFVIWLVYQDMLQTFAQSYLGLPSVVFLDAGTSCGVILMGAALGFVGSIVSLGMLDEIQR